MSRCWTRTAGCWISGWTTPMRCSRGTGTRSTITTITSALSYMPMVSLHLHFEPLVGWSGKSPRTAPVMERFLTEVTTLKQYEERLRSVYTSLGNSFYHAPPAEWRHDRFHHGARTQRQKGARDAAEKGPRPTVRHAGLSLPCDAPSMQEKTTPPRYRGGVVLTVQDNSRSGFPEKKRRCTLPP